MLVTMAQRYGLDFLRPIFIPLASRFEICLNSRVLSIQGIEHSQTHKSQHAQLLSTDEATTSPIAEEDEGVKTSTPSPHFEVTSPN